MYLLISLTITSLEEESTPGKYQCNIQKYFYITNFRLVQNGFITIYHEILNNLNIYPTYDINSDKRNSFTEFKVCCKYLICPASRQGGIWRNC